MLRRLQVKGDGGVNTIAFDTSGKRLAAAGRDGAVGVWDVTTGELLREFDGHDNLVIGVAFTPDGAKLVTTSADGTALIWDLTGRLAGDPGR